MSDRERPDAGEQVHSPQEPTAAEVHALFERVIDLDDAQRRAILDEVGARRPELRARVDALIAADTAADTLLDAEPSDLWAALLDDAEPEGRMVGPYRIVREIGRGGMGAVYLAERADGEFDQRVAVKLVKRGMDTDEILARFRHERRILASLEHPSIARLYDGGATDDGLPYLVMELVDGEPITGYCDRLHLSIDQRIDLFRAVCAAVQHAHQKLVVHRDIKPSNILVAQDGTPRLLDFGIALLLDEGDERPLTRTGARVLTPQYAAPEQIRGEPATTATDVFGLGAVLYELLTGLRPFEASRGRAAEPDRPVERPSSARTSSARTWSESSGTANEHMRPARPAMDKRGSATPGPEVRPDPAAIAAARSTTPDRLRRRLTGDLDNIVLRALAPDPQERYGSAQQLLDDLERHRDGRPVSARAPTLRYLTVKFARRHRSALAAAAIILLTLTAGLATTLWQARRAERERDAAELARANAEQVTAFLLNMFDSADPLGIRIERTDTLRVREIVDRGAARVRDELRGQPALQAEMMTMLGRVYSSLGIYDSAESMLEDALRTALSGASAPARAVPLTLLATAANHQGNFVRADSLLAEAVSLYERPGVGADSMYVQSVSERGLALMYVGDYDASRQLHQRALALIDSLDLHGSPLHARTLNNAGILFHNLAEYDTAVQYFRETLELERTYLGKRHPRLSSTLNNLASSTHYAGDLDAAEPLYVQAVDIAREGLGNEHAELGAFLQNLATLYDDQGRYDEAEQAYRQSLHAHEASLGRTSANTALLLRNYGLSRADAGDLTAAEPLLREAIASLTAGLGPDHLYTAVTASALGRVLTQTGATDEAHDLLARAVELLADQLPADHYLVAGARRDLGGVYHARGDHAAAEPLILEAYNALLASQGPDHHQVRKARQLLHDVYTALGRPDRAAEYLYDDTVTG